MATPDEANGIDGPRTGKVTGRGELMELLYIASGHFGEAPMRAQSESPQRLRCNRALPVR